MPYSSGSPINVYQLPVVMSQNPMYFSNPMNPFGYTTRNIFPQVYNASPRLPYHYNNSASNIPQNSDMVSPISNGSSYQEYGWRNLDNCKTDGNNRDRNNVEYRGNHGNKRNPADATVSHVVNVGGKFVDNYSRGSSTDDGTKKPDEGKEYKRKRIKTEKRKRHERKKR